jgi:tRNA-dihydrouridine synthase
MIGGVIMNQIKNILHKYLSPDAVAVCELSAKAGDFVWLEKMGYYNRKTGEETKEGLAYAKQHDKLMMKHFEKIKDNSLETSNLNELKQEVQKYIKNNPKTDIYKGLTETEAFALQYVNHGQW